MATTTNFGWETPDDTDLVKDGAAAIRTLGGAIDTSLVDLKGGTTGQILSKASNTDLDYTWVSPNPGDITEVTAGTGISGGGTSGAVTITNSMATAIDAKGDLIAGTGADTFSRIAVGANGYTLVADSSTSTGLAYSPTFFAGKNKIINGDFSINQRNFSSTTTSNTFGFDRWVMFASGGTVTYSLQTFTLGTAPVTGYEARNFARLVSASQSAAGDYAVLLQTIEDVRTFANQTVTISFWAKAGSGTPKVAVELQQNFGSGGSPSSAVSNYAGQVTLSTSWARYSVTVALGSLSGKTIGTNNDSFLGLNLWTSAGSNLNTRTGSLGVQNTTIDFWGVQVEAGSTATQFQTATGTIQGELAACQRYFYLHATNVANRPIGLGAYSSSTTLYIPITLPVVMRTAPTVYAGTATDAYQTLTGDRFNSLAIDQASTTQVELYNNTETAGTAGYATPVRVFNTSGYLGFNSEL